MTPEGRVKAKVNKALKTLGADCWRFMPVQTGFGTPALDYLLSVRGRFVAIETKAPGKNLTPLQEGTKAAIEAAGGLVFVVWDETSLELAMKIILALEFAPHDYTDANNGYLLHYARGEYHGGFTAERIRQEDEGPGQQHLRQQQSGEAAAGATGGHHGAS